MFRSVVGVKVGVVNVGAPAGLEATRPRTLEDVGVFKRFNVPGVSRVGGSNKLPGLKLLDVNVGVVNIREELFELLPLLLRLFSNDNLSPSRFPVPIPNTWGTDEKGFPLGNCLSSLSELEFCMIPFVESSLFLSCIF